MSDHAPAALLAGQIGTAFGVRTQRAFLRSVGVFTNRYLLVGLATELMLAAVLVNAPSMQALLGAAAAASLGSATAAGVSRDRLGR